MDRSDNESLSRHACPTEPSSKRSEAVRNVIIAFRGLTQRLLPIFHPDTLSKYISRAAATPKTLPGAEVHNTLRVALFFPEEEDFAADAIQAIVSSSAKGHNDREKQLSVVNNSNIMAGITATSTGGTTTMIGNSSSLSMASQEAAASTTTSETTSTRSQKESEPFDTTSSSRQPLTSDEEEREARWELQERENELRLQQLNAQRDKIKETYGEKKAGIEKEWEFRRREVRLPLHWWENGRLTELRKQLEEVTNELEERRAIEKEWMREEEEDGRVEDGEEDEEEEWDAEAAKRRIYKLETQKVRHEWEALCHRMRIQKSDHIIRLSQIEQWRAEALLKVEEEYNREMQAWSMMMDEYEWEMYAWYTSTRNGRQERSSGIKHSGT